MRVVLLGRNLMTFNSGIKNALYHIPTVTEFRATLLNCTRTKYKHKQTGLNMFQLSCLLIWSPEKYLMRSRCTNLGAPRYTVFSILKLISQYSVPISPSERLSKNISYLLPSLYLEYRVEAIRQMHNRHFARHSHMFRLPQRNHHQAVQRIIKRKLLTYKVFNDICALK